MQYDKCDMTSIRGQQLLRRKLKYQMITVILVLIGICDGFIFLQGTSISIRSLTSQQLEPKPFASSSNTGDKGLTCTTFLRMEVPTDLQYGFNNSTTSSDVNMMSGKIPQMYSSENSRSTTTTTATEFQPKQAEQSPFPMMPSQTFLNLASSQFEILINSITYHHLGTDMDMDMDVDVDESTRRQTKIKSLALYLPQENPNTGQLEFVPSLVFPTHPKSERVFIASDAQSGLPPTIPPTLTQLPGFAHAATLLPTYPFTTSTSSSSSSSSSSGNVGTPEEVFCDLKSSESSASTLSLPLFSGSQTIGILLIWGCSEPNMQHIPKTIARSMWTNEDKKQIQRVGETLAIALCMDSERFQNKIRSDEIRVAMANNLHQVKNPVQALRTFSKLLQRNLAMDSGGHDVTTLGRLVDDLVVQSDRVSDLLLPIDSIINSMESNDDGAGGGGAVAHHHQGLLMPTEQSSLVVVSNSAGRQSYETTLSPNSDSDDINSLPAKMESRIQKDTDTTEATSALRTRSRSNDHANELKLQISFVPDVLEPIFSSSKAMAAELGIDLQIEGTEEELPGVSVHPKLLQEAVVNVLDNAIKYVKLGANGKQHVENINPFIKFSLAPNKEHISPGVTITIEDNGPGISEIDKNSIFDRGYRGNATNGIVSGSGIGLNISRMMIERMGGSLELVDDDDHLNENGGGVRGGTTMRFILFRRPFAK